jgi:hypothetical protein
MRRRAICVPVLIACCVVALSSEGAASPIVIDFDGLADGALLTSQIPGLRFSNALIATAGISLNEFEFPPLSGSNVAIDTGGDLRIDFTSPLTAFAASFTYLAPITLRAFDSSGTLLASVLSAFGSNLALSGNAGSSPNELLGLTAANIAYVVVSSGGLGDSFAMDDATLTSSVPEPIAVGMLLCGLAGWASRTRSRRPRP